MSSATGEKFKTTACILCSINCGIKIEVANGTFKRILGDIEHPHSKGYLCQKASRLNYYQNHTGRLKVPLRRNSEGNFEKVNWETSISEIAGKLKHIRDTYGGHSIAYYGGGGQGNHMCQSYSSSLRAALNTRYIYTALAQEKTGDFWVNGKLFGRQSCHVAEDVGNTDYLIILGANPWQSHGITQARKTLREIKKDPKKIMVVIDPRYTETAAMADIHLQIKPGTDAFLLSAMLAIIVNEGLQDEQFINQHTVGFDQIKTTFQKISVKDYINKTDLDLELVKKVARGFANSEGGCIRADLGIQHSLNSTLNSYLEKLLFLITGNFGKKGCNNLHTQFAPIIGHSREPQDGGIITKVSGMHAISNMFPPNILPAEINSQNPDRIRALIVDSSNPILTAADSNAYSEAFKKLDLLIVIDVANTETAQMADYVLPAQSQFEKWEASFFTLDFPKNYFQLRRPVIKPEGDTLSEPEMYRRLMVAMGEIPERFPLLETIAKIHFRFPVLGLYPAALKIMLALRPKLKKYILIILYASLGKALPDGAQNAAMLWGVSYLYSRKFRKAVLETGLKGNKNKLGENLFRRIINNGSGICLSQHQYQDVWELLEHPDRKIHLEIAEMISALNSLNGNTKPFVNEEFPFILAAGERRSYNANQIFRDPGWRKKDRNGFLRIHTQDAKKIGLSDGDSVLCRSETGEIEANIHFDDSMRRGCLSLPHGYGFKYTSAADTDELIQNGPSINLLTSSKHCDPIAKTPYHKHLVVQLTRISE